MADIVYPDTPGSLWVFLIVTVVLGGLAAWATGNAIAKTWRPYVQVLIYALAIAAAVQFLHHALFGETLLSLQYYAVTYILTGLAGTIGYRRMRAEQMVTQYSFAFSPAGPFGWQPKRGV